MPGNKWNDEVTTKYVSSTTQIEGSGENPDMMGLIMVRDIMAALDMVCVGLLFRLNDSNI